LKMLEVIRHVGNSYRFAYGSGSFLVGGYWLLGGNCGILRCCSQSDISGFFVWCQIWIVWFKIGLRDKIFAVQILRKKMGEN
jgi:hypothetical protein